MWAALSMFCSLGLNKHEPKFTSLLPGGRQGHDFQPRWTISFSLWASSNPSFLRCPHSGILLQRWEKVTNSMISILHQQSLTQCLHLSAKHIERNKNLYKWRWFHCFKKLTYWRWKFPSVVCLPSNRFWIRYLVPKEEIHILTNSFAQMNSTILSCFIKYPIVMLYLYQHLEYMLSLLFKRSGKNQKLIDFNLFNLFIHYPLAKVTL